MHCLTTFLRKDAIQIKLDIVHQFLVDNNLIHSNSSIYISLKLINVYFRRKRKQELETKMEVEHENLKTKLQLEKGNENLLFSFRTLIFSYLFVV